MYPVEVEQALLGCPGVAEVAVFGATDERWGVGNDLIAPDAVTTFVRERLAPHKRPKDVYVVTELPRTSTGKVRRLALPEALGLGVR